MKRFCIDHRIQALFISLIISLPVASVFHKVITMSNLKFKAPPEEILVMNIQNFIPSPPEVVQTPPPEVVPPETYEPPPPTPAPPKPTPIKPKPVKKRVIKAVPHPPPPTPAPPEVPVQEVAVPQPSPTPAERHPATPTIAYTPSDPRLRDFVKAIERYKNYPRQARRMRTEGEVIVEFLWTSGAELKEVKIIKSSGSEILDKAALESIKSASRRFPKLKQDMRLSVPFSYKIE